MAATTRHGRAQHGTRRVEDAALLRGGGRFSDDLRLDGELAAVFVRSPHPHARVGAVEREEAARMPGVAGVFTAADMAAAGVGNVSRPPPQKGRDDRPLIVPHRPALAGGRVVHVGEPVAMVVAETVAAAEDAAERVTVGYEALASVSDAGAALADGAPQVWPEAAGNMALDWVAPSPEAEAAVDAALAGAANVVRIRVVNQRLAGAPLETRGATAVFDRDSGRFTLHAPSQGAHTLKAQLTAVMGIEPDRLRVLSANVGGAFGLKTPAYPEHAALMVAARALGRPVHWTATRSEAFVSDNQARDNVAEAALGLDGDGRFVALRVSAAVNLGAYVTSAGAVIGTVAFAQCFPGMYAIDAVAVGVRLAFTNTVPTGPYRGAGRPEANYVMERLVDAAARQTGIDPIDLRRRNLIPRAAMPCRTAVGNVYDSGDFAAALDHAVGLARLDRFAERRRAAERAGRRRGIGVSCFLEHAGAGPREGAVLAVEDDRIVLRLGVHPAGQGHATVFRDLVAAELGVAADRVVVEQGDSDLPIDGGPSVGSRSAFKAGSATVAVARDFVATLRAAAAGALQAEAADVAYREGYVEVAGTNRRMSVFELAKEVARRGGDLTTHTQVEVANTFPNGCHIAEVEIDPETGATRLADYVAVDDCGVVLDHTLAEAQVVGGVAQGIGQALMEAIVYDASGQLIGGTLLDYAMPRADALPPIRAEFHPVRCTTNALGAKGVGEAGTTAALAAVMNAIADAVPDGRGAAIDMPATAEKVWRAFNAG